MSLGQIENADQVREALRLAAFREGSQRAFATKHGISEMVLSDMIRGKREVSMRIASMVGFDRITIYRCQTAKERES